MKEPPGPGATPELDPASRARVDQMLRFSQMTDGFAVVLEAAKMAVDAGRQAPGWVDERTAIQFLRCWLATNLLIGRMFDEVYREGHKVIQAVREQLMPD